MSGLTPPSLLAKRRMKFFTEQSHSDRVLVSDRLRDRQAKRGFTLVEVMVVMALVTILIAAGFGATYSMDLCSRRVADYTAVMAVVDAKVQDIRAVYYNPPNYPFRSSVVYVTNSDSISLDKAGTTFKVSGTLISRIEPVTGGHLVTVTGTFQEPRKPIVVTIRTAVNKFSGGQQ